MSRLDTDRSMQRNQDQTYRYWEVLLYLGRAAWFEVLASSELTSAGSRWNTFADKVSVEVFIPLLKVLRPISVRPTFDTALQRDPPSVLSAPTRPRFDRANGMAAM